MANTTELIKRSTIFGNPDKTAVQVSNLGNYISYLSNINGVLNVFIADIANIKDARPVTNDTSRGIRQYFWSKDDKYILYMQDNGGDENFRIHRVNLQTLEDTILTPKDGVKTVLYRSSHKKPNEIMIGLNSRRKDFFDLYRLNISTGELFLIYENNKFHGHLIIDDEHNLRFGSIQKPDMSVEVVEFKNENESIFLHITYEDQRTSSLVGLNEQEDNVYLISSEGRNTNALYAVDLKTKSRALLYSNQHSDLEHVLFQPVTKRLDAVTYEYTKIEYQIFDREFEVHFEKLKNIHQDANISIVSRSIMDDKWIVAFNFDNGPARYYLYDKTICEAKYMFGNMPKLEGYKLNKMHPVIIKSRDGLNLVSYISIPEDAKVTHNDYKTKQPLPMVLLVHGGPNARDSWGFERSHQWLTNRGYAVLSVNYRGSTGFGKDFITAGDGQWAGKMHDDLIDAVDWAIENGIADKDKVAIMGGSYGGYAALVGLTFTPEKFVCGVDIVGVSNLITLINSIPEYWKPYLEIFKKMLGGDPNTADGAEILKSKSPLFHSDKIKKPLLIAHGQNDPRVKQAESDQIVDKLNSQGIPVTYILYKDEGHGFARPENRLSFYAITEGFLSKYLGGRYEEIGEDFENSSIQITSGKQYLPFRLP
ncbi:S9 family peptidase [Candidatus Cyrtobacter comes]|uniref:S9 family peptidase n=1 Tax=Candidatus Cyrtobacter comes TaxID=675776 RepID=A0ABU5L8B1_9RICK|nr:S9 family peptidase [Candidatus Cyrtobacter comes]MDZ5762362.1 S9 family peptidase [Candidatus Cyrtobacter comes]